MDEIGASYFTSYIFLGLSLSIGLLVYFLVRDAQSKRRKREEEEQRRAEELLHQLAEEERKQRLPTGEKAAGNSPATLPDQNEP